MTKLQTGRTGRDESQNEVKLMTKQDYLISIENAASALCKADRATDVTHILQVFGHGARTIDDLSSSDYEAVFSELFQREADLKE